MKAGPPPTRPTPERDTGSTVTDHRIADSSSTEGLPIAPSMGPTLESILTPRRTTAVNGRVVFITVIAVAIGLAAGLVAQILLRLIGLITNLSFYGRLTPQFASPTGNHLGLFVIVVPAVGGLIVGLMARYGSEGIRGHGIPEVMEQVLRNQSRILASSHLSQANFRGHRYWDRRSFWRRRSYHRNWGSPWLADWPVSQDYR